MKKVFIALAAVAALASCSKSDYSYVPENQEIGIVPLAENRTKAMVSGPEFPSNEKFAVWAFYKQLPAGTTNIAAWQASSEVQQTYIDEKPFAPKTGDQTGLWGGDGVTYFWPKAGSLMFVGYYPVSIDNPTPDNPEGRVKYEFTKDVNKMTISGYTPGDYQTTGFVNTEDGADHVEDFMYFNMTATSCDASTLGPENSVKSGNHVDVVFRHALSWLNVVLKKDSNTPDGATITVKKVYFTNINTTGTGTVNNSPSTGETNEISWVTTDDVCDVYVLGSEAGDNANALTADYTCKQPVLIPQSMDGNLVITYEIKSGDGSAFTETKTVALTKSNEAWMPGKKYTYTITIGTTEILIDPNVTTWDGKTVAVPVE